MAQTVAEKIAAYKFRQRKAKEVDREFYAARSLDGVKCHTTVDGVYGWFEALFKILLGGREAGKTVWVQKRMYIQWKKKGARLYWIRLQDKSCEKLLKNRAEKLLDPLIRRWFNIDNLSVKGSDVYIEEGGKKKKFMTVLSASTYYGDKGISEYDAEDPSPIIICLDEMNRDQGERNSFDVVYGVVNQLENIARSKKRGVEIYMLGNLITEASDILTAFNFIPEEFGRYVLHDKRCIIDYMPPSEKYLKRRSGTVADQLAGDNSTFTNVQTIDKTRICKNRLCKPTCVLKFGKKDSEKFTVWDNFIIAQYNGEKVREILMRPYIDGVFQTELRDDVIAKFDGRYYMYHTLLAQQLFTKQLQLLKPRK